MKLTYVILVASVLFLASCAAQHTCPTYMKKDANKELSARV